MKRLSYFQPSLTEWRQNPFSPVRGAKIINNRVFVWKMFTLAHQKCDWHDRRPLLLLQLRPVLASTWGGTVFSARLRHIIQHCVCAHSVFYLSPVQQLMRCTYLSCLFFSTGFPDYVPPPRGGNLPYHVLIREQHGTSGNLGHVSPRCSWRADRGERWLFWAYGWSAAA